MERLALLLCVALLLIPVSGFAAIQEDDNIATTETITIEKETVVSPPVEIRESVETPATGKESINRAAAIADKVGDITSLSVFTSAGLPGAVIGAISVGADALGFIFRHLGRSKKESAKTQPAEEPTEPQN